MFFTISRKLKDYFLSYPESLNQVGEPQAIEKDGMLMVIQSESSHVMMSDDTLQRIIQVTQEIRNLHMNI